MLETTRVVQQILEMAPAMQEDHIFAIWLANVSFCKDRATNCNELFSFYVFYP